MTHSEQIEEIAAALCRAQGTMRPAPRSGVNPHLKSRYSTLEDIVEAVREPLYANGLSHSQGAETEGNSVVVTTLLMHSSGQMLVNRVAVPLAQNSAQGYGSALKYGRRYGLSALLGIVDGEDDDAHAAMAAAVQSTPAPPPKQSAPTENPEARALQQFLLMARDLGYDVPDTKSAARLVKGLLEWLPEQGRPGVADIERAIARLQDQRTAEGEADTSAMDVETIAPTSAQAAGL